MTTVASSGTGPVVRGRGRAFRWPARYVPWSGRATRVDLALMGSFLAVVAFGLAIRPLKPFLLASHPVLLELLTGDLVTIGAGAAFARVGETSLSLVVVAGAVGMVKLDWLMWWAGRRWGEGILRMFTTEQSARSTAERARSLNPWVLRVLVAFAFLPGIPTPAAHAGAGLAGMRLRTFLLLDLGGALLMSGLVAGLGYAAGQSAVDLVLLVDRYATVVSLVLLSLTVLLPVVRSKLRRRTTRPPRDPGAGRAAG